MKPFLRNAALLVALVAGPSFARAQQTTEAASPQLQEFIEAGDVTFEFYDRKKPPRRYPGWTRFHLDVVHRYTYQYTSEKDGATLVVDVRPTITKLECKLVHQVSLPDSLQNARRWNDRLLRHELDHVAITLDPRPRLLLEHLCHKLGRLTCRVPETEGVDKRAISELITEQVVARRTAVIALMRANYQLLDRVSQHGNVAIPERAAFFCRLYTKPNLDESGFPPEYIADVLDLLRSEAYQQAELPVAKLDRKLLK